MTIKKIILFLSLLAGALTISSCTKEEHVQEYHIKSDCSGLVCRLSVEDDAIDRYINLLGKPKDKVIKRVLLNSAQDELTWSILGNGTFADNSQLEHRNLAPCTDDEDGCSPNSNPTGFVFESIGPEQIGVSGSIINDNGSITQIDEQSTIDVETGKPIVSIAHGTDDELAYTFTADSTDTGIPDGATYTWYVDNNEVGTGESIDYTFNAAGTVYKVKLVVSSPDLTDDIVVENDITSGYIPPVINEPVINGKTVSVSVDVTNTGLPSGTTYTWSVVGETVTATGTSATLELPAYATDYTITLTTTSPEGDEITSTKNITTGYGDIALSSESVGGSGTDYRFTADTSNTGLPETATFEWKIDGVTQTQTTNILDHDFLTLGSYEVSVQAKVDGNLVGSPVTEQLNLTAAGEPGIQVNQGSNNLEKVFTADLNATGIDGSWTKSWEVDGNTIAGETGNSFTYQFADPDTNYSVTFTATKDSQTKTASYNFTTPPINLNATTNLDIGVVNASRTAAIEFLPAETGITDDWSFQWSSSDTSATFNAPTAKNTSVTFSVAGDHTVTMTATSPGNTVVQVTSDNIRVAAGQPNVHISRNTDDTLAYTFTADPTDTGIPDGATYTWYVDNNEVGTGESTVYTFNAASTLYQVKLVVSSPDLTDDIVVETNITSGYIPPVINEPVVNGKTVSVSVDVTNTGLPAGTTYTWSVVGETVTATGTSATLELPAYATDYTITLTTTTPEGDEFISTKNITTVYGDIALSSESVGGSGTDYKFTADTSNTGLPVTATFEWKIDGVTQTQTTNILDHDFLTLGSYEVSVQAKVDGNLVGSPVTEQLNLTAAGEPGIQVNQGSNNLEKVFTAELNATGIDGSWTKSWEVDGNTIAGETGNSFTYQFSDPDTNYSVTFTATKDSQTKTASYNFTTPPINLNATTNLNIGVVNASRTAAIEFLPAETGITDDWSFQWSSSDTSATFNAPTAKNTSVTFSVAGDHTVTMTATSPGNTVVQVTSDNIRVAAGQPNVHISRNTDDTLAYTFTADPTDTGIPDGATYTWYVDNNEVGTGESTVYTFNAASTLYQVKLVVSSPDLTDDIVVETDITSGYIPPVINEPVVNGKTVSVSVDVTNTGLPSGTTYTWSVVGETVTATGTSATLELPAYATDYTITLTTTTPEGDEFTSTKNITTVYGDIALSSESVGGSGTDYKFTADTSNTGLPVTATFEWKIDGVTQTQTTNILDHDFLTLGSYEVSVQAKVDGNLVGSPVTEQLNITEAGEPGIQVNQGSNNLEKVFTAELNATGIDGSWTKSWEVDGNTIAGETGNSFTYQFADPDTNYSVKFTATKDSQTKTASYNFTTPPINLDATTNLNIGSVNASRTAAIEFLPAESGITDNWSFQWSSSDTSATFSAPTAKNTSVTFSVAGDHTVTMTATSPGNTVVQVTSDNIRVAAGQPNVHISRNTDDTLAYTFTADPTDTGIPDGATYTWYVDNNEVGTGESTVYTFNAASTLYQVKLVVSSPDLTDDIVVETDITSGYIPPVINEPVVNGKTVSVSVDVTNTGLPSGTTYTWSVVGETVTATGTSATLELPAYATDYTITLTTTTPEGDEFTSTKNITTVYGDIALSSESVGGSGTDYKFTADTSNTGLPVTATFEWKIDGVTQTQTTNILDHDFLTLGSYEVSVQAKVDGNLVGSPVTEQLNITAAGEPGIQVNQGSNNLEKVFTAELNATGIDGSWTKSWEVDGNTIAGETGNSFTYQFPDPDTNYSVKFTATKDSQTKTASYNFTTPPINLDATTNLNIGSVNASRTAAIEFLPAESGITDNWSFQWSSSDTSATFNAPTAKNTSVTFSVAGDHTVTMTATSPGNTVVQVTSDNIRVAAGQPNVHISRNTDDTLAYTFTADPTDTGIPDGATYTWYVDNNEVGTGESTVYTFNAASTLYQVKLVVSSPDLTDDIVVETDITSGYIPPVINEPVVNGKTVSVSVDVTNTGLPSGTTYTWSVVGETVTATGTSATLELPAYATDYTITLTTTTPEGDEFTSTKNITTVYGDIALSSESVGGSGTDYKFTADTSNTGLPVTATFEWKIDGVTQTQTTNILDHDFLTLGSYEVSVQAKVDGNLVGSPVTEQLNITEAGEPGIQVNQGSNNLEKVFTAELNATGIDGSWTKSWEVDGNTIAGETGNSFTYQFSDPDTNYSVTFTATKDSQTKTASYNFTTPPINLNATTNLNIGVVNASRTAAIEFLPAETGITDDWSFQWSSSETSATFNAPTAKNTNVTFPVAGDHTVTMTATSPGNTVVQVTSDNIRVAAGQPNVHISRNTDDTLAYTFTAYPTDTGIPNGATYTWYVENNEVGTGESTVYTFNAASTLYQVKLVVSSPDLTDDIVVETNITSGYIPPVINEPVVNGKTVSVSVDVTNTGLPSGTTYTWSVVGETVTATGTSATLELPAYATDYTITLTTTTPEGDELTSTKNITTGYGDIALSSESVGGSGTDYKFTADTSNTGLPVTATFEWKIDGVTQTQTTNILDHDFLTLGSYEVSVQAKVDGNLVGSPVTEQLNITEAGEPGIQVNQGSNNLEKVFTADLNATGIDGSWTKSWEVDGNTIAGETGNSFTYQFADPDTNYSVKFTATKDSQTKTASYNFTTPPINLDATTNLNIGVVNASRTAAIEFLPAETGITDDWSFQWSSSETSATFNAPTAKNTNVTFPVAGDHTVTMTATSPGNTVVQVTSDNIRVAAGQPNVNISRNTNDTLAYTFTADPTDTGIPDGATYTWYVDNNEVGTGESLNYTFNAASTLYQVKLVVSSPDLTDDIVVETNITSGYTPPVINEPVINGKIVSVSVDVTNTGLPVGTTYTWYVEGITVTTGINATLELPAYATDYTITLTTTPPEGDELISTKNITTGYGDIALSSESVGGSGTDYKFTANTSNTGLPVTATFEWKIDGVTQTQTTNILDHDFLTLGSYEVSVQAKVDGNLVVSPVTEQLNITEAGDPGVQVNQGSNNLEKVFTADLNATGIDGSWTKSWEVDGNTIAGETGNSFTYQFADPDTNYSVTFTATKDSQTKTASYNFTTSPINLDATTNLNIGSVNSSRTAAIEFLPAESGITDNWSFQWSSSDTSATFNAPTAKNTSVTFSVAGVHTVTMTATSPGNTVVQVTSRNIVVPPAAIANMDWIIRDLPSGTAGPYSGWPYVQAGNMVGISCPSGADPVNNFNGTKVISRYATPTATNASINGSSIPANTRYAIRLHTYTMSGSGASHVVHLYAGSSGAATGGLSLSSTVHFVGGTPPNPFLHLICVSRNYGTPWSNISI